MNEGVNDYPSAPGARVLIYSPWAAWRLHSDVDYFLARELRSSGSEVFLVACNGSEQCHVRDLGATCESCMALSDDSASHYSINRLYLDKRKHLNDELVEGVESLSSLEDIQNFEFMGAKVGVGVASTIATFYRQEPKMLAQNRHALELAKKYLVDAVLTYLDIDSIIKEKAINRVVLFNGRLAPFFAALQAAQKNACVTYVQERGFVESGYLYFNRGNCLDYSDFKERFGRFEGLYLTLDCYHDALSHVQRKSLGFENAGPSFMAAIDAKPTKIQVNGGRQTIGVYTSSVDEAVFSDLDFVADQMGTIQKIIDNYADDFNIIIRHHPNLGGKGIGGGQKELLYQMRECAKSYPGSVTVVWPEDAVNSHTLASQLDVAVIPGSSMSVDLSAVGVPTIVHDRSSVSAGILSALRYKNDDELLCAIENALTGKVHRVEIAERALKFTYVMHINTALRFGEVGWVLPQNGIRRSVGKLITDLNAQLICNCIIRGVPIEPELRVASCVNGKISDNALEFIRNITPQML